MPVVTRLDQLEEEKLWCIERLKMQVAFVLLYCGQVAYDAFGTCVVEKGNKNQHLLLELANPLRYTIYIYSRNFYLDFF